MNIKDSYDYFYYKLYKFWSIMSYAKFWVGAKALYSISVLEIFILASFFVLYTDFINKTLPTPSKTAFIIVGLIPTAINYFMFIYAGRWKLIVQNFDLLPKNKNNKGSLIAAGIAAFIIIFFFIVLIFL